MNVPNFYEKTLYPNLYVYWALVGTNEWAFAQHAGITTELFMAALKEREPLCLCELFNISQFTDVPVEILMLPQIVRMERNHYKHRKMIDDLYACKEELLDGAAAGHDWCKRFVERRCIGASMEDLEQMHDDFYAGKHVSYTRYLAIKHEVTDCIRFFRADQRKPRDISPEKKKPKEKVKVPDKLTCISMLSGATEEQAVLVKQFLIDNGIWNEQYNLEDE